MPLEIWLSQLIKYVSAMEKQDRADHAREELEVEPDQQVRDGDLIGELEPDRQSSPGLLPESELQPEPESSEEREFAPQGQTGFDDEASALSSSFPFEQSNEHDDSTTDQGITLSTEDEVPVTLTDEAVDADGGAAEPAGEADSLDGNSPADTIGPTVVPWPSAAPQPEPSARKTGGSDAWSVSSVPIDAVHSSRFAIDQEPAEAEVEAALEAWHRSGALEPIVVRRDPYRPDGFEIVTGTARWRAAARADLAEVPVVIKDLSDQEALRAILVQRLRRKAVSPVDEARIYRRLMREGGSSAEELARAIGKAPAHVVEMVELLDLPEAVQDLVENGELTVLHGRALLRASDPVSAAREVVARRLDIYQTEQLVRSAKNRPPSKPTATVGNANDNVATVQLLERQLSSLLGLKVSITERNEVGVLSVHYTSRDQLSDLISRLNTSAGG